MNQYSVILFYGVHGGVEFMETEGRVVIARELCT